MTATSFRSAAGMETSLVSQERLALPWTEIHGSPVAASSREVLPTGSFRRKTRILPNWIVQATKRIAELGALERGWDSYDGEPLQPGSVLAFRQLVHEFGQAIQTEPAISLTGDGGLFLSWDNDETSLQYIAQSDGSASVFYAETSGREWEGSAAECAMLEKWLWRASGKVCP